MIPDFQLLKGLPLAAPFLTKMPVWQKTQVSAAIF